MPTLALIGIPGLRWLPALPVPLFFLWPFLPVCLGIARLLDRDRPTEAAKLRASVQVFCDLRGLSIDTQTRDRKRIRIRFI